MRSTLEAKTRNSKLKQFEKWIFETTGFKISPFIFLAVIGFLSYFVGHEVGKAIAHFTNLRL